MNTLRNDSLTNGRELIALGMEGGGGSDGACAAQCQRKQRAALRIITTNIELCFVDNGTRRCYGVLSFPQPTRL